MASLEVTKKVNYVGVWQEDVFVDELITNVAGYAKAEKGKKVKLTLNSSSLCFTRSKWFQEKRTELYPIAAVRAVMRNPRSASCVMFILTDPVKKYRIIAVRCASEGDAIHLTNMFQQIQREAKTSNVELKKRENGNWTLRERSAHNANRHLAEIFNERSQQQQQEQQQKQQQKQQQQQQQRVKPSQQLNGNAVAVNGNASHVPILDKSKVVTTATDPGVVLHTSYVKRTAVPVSPTAKATTITSSKAKRNNFNNNNNNNNVARRSAYTVDNDDYVIETEVESHPHASKQSSNSRHNSSSTEDLVRPASEAELAVFKGDINNLTEEVKGIKVILQNMTTPDSADGPRLGNYRSKILSTPSTHYYDGQTALPSRPMIYTAVADTRVTRSADFQPTIVRGPVRNYEAKLISARSYQHDPWASHRRVSGSYVLPSKLDYRLYAPSDSGRSSLRVKFDSESIKSGASSRSKRSTKTLRLVPAGYSVATTVERPIEETYGRPVIVRRHSASQIAAMRPRPASYHAMSSNELKVFRPTDRYMDVAL